jgi:hypothetical protein
MALSCFRCAGYTELDHARTCPHRESPSPVVVAELPWPTGDDGQPVSLGRALQLAQALDETERYWVEFTSTDDPETDAELVQLEDRYHSLGAIQRYCQHYDVGAVYGDGPGVQGAITRSGALVTDAPNPREVALG